MKILTVCQGGACRSVAMAVVLKEAGDHDALAAAWRYNSVPTFALLCDWAEIVVVMQNGGQKYLPVTAKPKLRLCDVGPDRWRFALHPELMELCSAWAREHHLIS